MAVRTREELISLVNDIVGENADDKVISLLEDITDTYNDFDTRTNSTDTEDWKKKYEDNDKQWREKYKARFLSNDTEQNVPSNIDSIGADTDDEAGEAPTTFEELFTTE